MGTPLDREAVQRMLTLADAAPMFPLVADESHVVEPGAWPDRSSPRETPTLFQVNGFAKGKRDGRAAYLAAAANLAPLLARAWLAQADELERLREAVRDGLHALTLSDDCADEIDVCRERMRAALGMLVLPTPEDDRERT